MGGVTRRQLIGGGAAAGALLVAGPGPGAGIAAAPTRLGGASRRSKLFPRSRRFLVHADLHNHSVLSGDADGDPDTAYEQLATAGLDAASLTEHAIMGKGHGQVVCPSGPCKRVVGMNDADWRHLRALADAANKDGSFTAIRGFEWTTPTMGHVNVWFGSEWIDGLRTGAITTPRGGTQLDELGEVPPAVIELFERLPDTASMDGLYDWLARPPGRGLLGGGRDALAGFNHPNEFGNFDEFDYDPRIAQRMVTCEALNWGRDFFFYGTEEGKPHPLAACLDAGWRTGFIGVSDNHDEVYGDIGDRAGMWVTELSRRGMREALVSRRVFATRVAGMRLDAAAAGEPMGSTVRRRHGGPLRVEVDIDGGEAWTGRPIVIQVIRPGRGSPTLASAVERRVPRDDQPPISFHVDVDPADRWLFLRITDPTKPPDGPMPAAYAAGGRVIAYSSPFFLESGGGSDGGGRKRDDVPRDVRRRGLPSTGTPAPLGVGAAALIAAAGLLRARASRLHELSDHPH